MITIHIRDQLEKNNYNKEKNNPIPNTIQIQQKKIPNTIQQQKQDHRLLPEHHNKTNNQKEHQRRIPDKPNTTNNKKPEHH